MFWWRVRIAKFPFGEEGFALSHAQRECPKPERNKAAGPCHPIWNDQLLSNWSILDLHQYDCWLTFNICSPELSNSTARASTQVRQYKNGAKPCHSMAHTAKDNWFSSNRARTTCHPNSNDQILFKWINLHLGHTGSRRTFHIRSPQLPKPTASLVT